MTASEPMTEPECVCLDELEGAPHAVVFDRDTPRTIRLTLGSEQQLPGHRHPGTNVVCHLVAGELDLTLDGESHRLAAGDLLRFSGDREISPTAIEDSVAVLVFAPQKD
ncbi:cupin domain-containing protein [Halococcus qingdaonensis]|uniref:cupin domain-containing protein n=1 Tax=Halococcus qingdaonensis TaxID=224402 RepID=UPI002116E03D|nr:cupin domain-containing protein [Halococcus qingdaonensis]